MFSIPYSLAKKADPRLCWDLEDNQNYATSSDYVERMRSLGVPVEDWWLEEIKKFEIPTPSIVEAAIADPRVFGQNKIQLGSYPCEFVPESGDALNEFLADSPVEEWVRFRNNWVSKQTYYLDSLFFAITGNTTTFASIDKGFPGSLSPPVNIWLLRLFGNFKVASNNDSKNYWKVDLNRFNQSGASSTIGSFSTQNQGTNNVEYNVNLNLQLNVASLNLANFSFGYSKISSAGALSGQARVAYRKVRNSKQLEAKN
jgi:hypothetical protein